MRWNLISNQTGMYEGTYCQLTGRGVIMHVLARVVLALQFAVMLTGSLVSSELEHGLRVSS